MILGRGSRGVKEAEREGDPVDGSVTGMNPGGAAAAHRARQLAVVAGHVGARHVPVAHHHVGPRPLLAAAAASLLNSCTRVDTARGRTCPLPTLTMVPEP